MKALWLAQLVALLLMQIKALYLAHMIVLATYIPIADVLNESITQVQFSQIMELIYLSIYRFLSIAYQVGRQVHRQVGRQVTLVSLLKSTFGVDVDDEDFALEKSLHFCSIIRKSNFWCLQGGRGSGKRVRLMSETKTKPCCFGTSCYLKVCKLSHERGFEKAFLNRLGRRKERKKERSSVLPHYFGWSVS